MHRIGVNRFFWPQQDDVLWYLHEDVIRMIPPPTSVTSRHMEIDRYRTGFSSNVSCQLCYFVCQLCYVWFLCRKAFKCELNHQLGISLDIPISWGYLWRWKSWVRMVNNTKFSILWIYVEESFILHDSIPQSAHYEAPNSYFQIS